LTWNPLLVVESEMHLDCSAHHFLQLFLWHVLASKEPGKGRNDALEAPELPVPVCCDLSFALLAAELDPLDL